MHSHRAMPLLLTAAAACFITACSPDKPTGAQPPDGQNVGKTVVSSPGEGSAQAVRTGSDDPTDPTAMHLHDLAGRLLLYQIQTGQLPESFASLDRSLKPGQPPSGLDPGTGKPLIYLPQAPRPAKMTGRLLVCQSTPQPSGYRWALVLSDSSAPGRSVILVQRLPESVFTWLQTNGGGW